MKFNISPGTIIFIFGFGGLIFTLVDDAGQIGSKIPIALFFIVIISIGILIEMFSENKMDEVYGEFERDGGIS